VKKYKYITIKPAEQFNENNKVILATSSGKPVYHITNNKSNGFLGWILWYPAWKQFVFTAVSDNVVFNNSCLRDVFDFMENHAKSEGKW
jgi:hypothetical protein